MAYLWDYDGWQMIPGNMDQQEPSYILTHSLRALVQRAKIIAIIRGPDKQRGDRDNGERTDFIPKLY